MDEAQKQAMAEAVARIRENMTTAAKAAGVVPLGVEGMEFGEWVLVDLGDIVVHVMQPAVRAYYNLEELWATTPARRGKLMAGTEASARD